MDEKWFMRSNKDLMKIYTEPSIVVVIRAQLLRRIGPKSRLQKKCLVK